MLQPSAIPTSVSSELTESLQQTLSANRIRTLRALGIGISLPNDLRSFILFLLAILLVCTGMTMQILLSIQIWRTTAKVEGLKTEYRTIEQQNAALVWEIAQKSTLENVRQRAEALGYNVALNRYYVTAPQASLATMTNVRPTLAAPMPTLARPVAPAAKADTPVLNTLPKFGLGTHLQNAAHTVEEWWQKQWQKILRKS